MTTARDVLASARGLADDLLAHAHQAPGVTMTIETSGVIAPKS